MACIRPLCVWLLLLAPAIAAAQGNDLGGIDVALEGQDRSSELTIVTDMIATAWRIVEDFVAPLMGLILILAGIHQGARYGDLGGAFRFFIFGMLCFGLPYLITVLTQFMS